LLRCKEVEDEDENDDENDWGRKSVIVDLIRVGEASPLCFLKPRVPER